MEYSSYNVNTPQWREITVGSHLPAELRKLAEIAHNLWWTWIGYRTSDIEEASRMIVSYTHLTLQMSDPDADTIFKANDTK